MTPTWTRRRLLHRAGVTAAVLTVGAGHDAWAHPMAAAGDTRLRRSDKLRRQFAAPIDVWQAGDVPHQYPLPNGDVVWLLNDSFTADRHLARFDGQERFVRNAALVEGTDGLRTISDSHRSFFDDGEDRYDRWWWFHGGAVDGDLLRVISTEMVRVGPYGWAINFDAASTWVTSIDWRSMRVVDHAPAPNRSTDPVYGFSVASDDDWSYLFGNTHHYRGSNRTYLARVPRGRLLDRPGYWAGAWWSDDPADAEPVHHDRARNCRLHVTRHGERWVATAKIDEFLGSSIAIYRADRPQGPWTELLRFRPPTATGDTRTCTYDAMCATDSDGELMVWWSNNAFEEHEMRAQPRVYGPRFASIQLPPGDLR